MKHDPYTLPASDARWHQWEKSFAAQASPADQNAVTLENTYTHESACGPTLDEDVAAFEAEWQTFAESCKGHLRRLLAVFAVAAALILFLWLLGAFGPADAAGRGGVR